MKKTMFITSVIMVVVMAIALTTSSLAWFTSGGNDSVTTDALKVTAQGSTSTGIAISHDKTQWSNNVILTSNGTGANEGVQVNMMPLVPYTGMTNANISAYTAAEMNAALVAALVGGSENAYDADNGETFAYYGTTVDSTSYAAKMIGAKIDSNAKFTSDVYRTGYFTDTIYLKNLAAGAGAEDIRFNVDINFSFHKIVSNVNTKFDYDSTNRGAALYQEDAKLCVAVLARVDEFDTDANLDDPAYNPTSGTYATTAAYADPEKWEIVAYADSKGGSTISLGKDYSAFLALAASGVSFSDQSIATLGLNKINSESLRPERAAESTGNTLAPTIKTVKIVAWYDGATLTNNNSTKMDLEFDLSFNRKVNNGTSWVDPE